MTTKKHLDWKRIGWTVGISIVLSLIHYCLVNNYLDWVALREILIAMPIFLLVLSITFSMPNKHFYYHNGSEEK